jgi:hypothetical protein
MYHRRMLTATISIFLEYNLRLIREEDSQVAGWLVQKSARLLLGLQLAYSLAKRYASSLRGGASPAIATQKNT